MDKLDLSALRDEYLRSGLHERDLDSDPLKQFIAWFEEARRLELPDVNAMTLATSGPDGEPAARVVLLKGVDERGFSFFTNYESDKGRDLDANPRAALLFFWGAIERQVRIVGDVARLPREATLAYARSRPRGSQLSTWVSRQSSPVSSREALEEAFERVRARYEGVDPLPVPEYWGGYVVAPRSVEFWQGRASRLHDRVRYRRDVTGGAGGAWLRERLSP